MFVKLVVSLTVFVVVVAEAGEPERRPSPQLPISVLDEILKNNGNTNNNNLGIDNNDLNSILGMIGGTGGDNTTSDDSNSTGIGILDFFRNLIAMFLRTFLQVFRFLQLLARSITGIGSKKLAFLSTDQRFSDFSDNESKDQKNVKRVLRQIQKSAEEYPMDMLVSDNKIKELEDKMREVLKILPNVENKSLDEILDSQLLTNNLIKELEAIGRHKRQIIGYDNEIEVDLGSLLDQYYRSHLESDLDLPYIEEYVI